MITSRNLPWRDVFRQIWRPMLYFLALSVLVFGLHRGFRIDVLQVPFSAVAVLSTALAIYLGFKNNNAYERWWEARTIWGSLVNYSRAFCRQICTLPAQAGVDAEGKEVRTWQHRVLSRHMAFVHALRVFLRAKPAPGLADANHEAKAGSYEDLGVFLSPDELSAIKAGKNPPNLLLHRQGFELREARERGWITDYEMIRLEETLIQFNNHQGSCERIKNTPLPRPYGFYSRVFVFVHGTIIPFAFIEHLGWLNILLSIAINFVFVSLDVIGEQTENPFENRSGDVPLMHISLTIEQNIKEALGVGALPDFPDEKMGVRF